MATNIPELSVDQLRLVCDPGQFTFHSTEELPSLDDIIGQERAMRAIAFGMNIKTPGYHVYALGPAGTGKTTIIKKFLDREANGFRRAWKTPIAERLARAALALGHEQLGRCAVVEFHHHPSRACCGAITRGQAGFPWRRVRAARWRS